MPKLSSPFHVYKVYLINQCCTNKNYLCPHNPIFCFLSENDDYASDNASIKRCYDSQLNEGHSSRVSFFTKDPESLYVDNCANTHILNNKAHFVHFNPI